MSSYYLPFIPQIYMMNSISKPFSSNYRIFFIRSVEAKLCTLELSSCKLKTHGDSVTWSHKWTRRVLSYYVGLCAVTVTWSRYVWSFWRILRVMQFLSLQSIKLISHRSYWSGTREKKCELIKILWISLQWWSFYWSTTQRVQLFKSHL